MITTIKRRYAPRAARDAFDMPLITRTPIDIFADTLINENDIDYTREPLFTMDMRRYAMMIFACCSIIDAMS